MGNIFLSVSLQVLFLMCSSANMEANMKACIDNYELAFFCDAINFDVAKKVCEDKGSYLVKIDSANMTKIINDVMDEINCSKMDFHAGAKADPERNWKWLDGSKVYLRNEDGYQNWRDGQPNDVGGREDCLNIDKNSKQWVDSPCGGVVDGKPAEQRYYICQKNLTLNIDVEEFSQNAINCSGTSGSCVNQVEWRRNNEIVSSSQSHSVYQVFSAGSSILYYENATIRDGGEYSCVTWVLKKTVNQVSAFTNIKVNGTPTINEMVFSACNNSLKLFWNSHSRAIGFPHRIKIKDSMSGDLVNNIVETPIDGAGQVTEITGLRPSTVYHVEISSCKNEDLCSVEYTVNATATTGGVIIKNATLYQMDDNNICIVKWKWPYNISAVFEVNITSSFDGTPRVNIFELDLVANKTDNELSYSFVPHPEQIHEVQIQPAENSKLCPKSVKAVGSCMGEESDYTTTKITDIVIPISAAGGGFVFLVIIVILLYYKCGKSKRNSKNLKENPIYGVTNSAVNESDYNHLHSNSNKQKTNKVDHTTDRKSMQNNPSASSELVVNPIYGDADFKTNNGEGALTEEQQESNDAPIYSAVRNVKSETTQKNPFLPAYANSSRTAEEEENRSPTTMESLNEDVIYAVVDK